MGLRPRHGVTALGEPLKDLPPRKGAALSTCDAALIRVAQEGAVTEA